MSQRERIRRAETAMAERKRRRLVRRRQGTQDSVEAMIDDLAERGELGELLASIDGTRTMPKGHQ